MIALIKKIIAAIVAFFKSEAPVIEQQVEAPVKIAEAAVEEVKKEV